MDWSQRRASGQEAPFLGYRLKLFLVLSLFASAAGYFAYSPADRVQVQPVGTLAVSTCESTFNNGADDAAPCSFDAAPESDRPTPDIYSVDAKDPSTPSAENSPNGRHDDIPRAWPDNQANSNPPRAGYTIAELCAASTKDNVLQCQTGDYKGKFAAANSRVSEAIQSGSSISGRVLTTTGRGLADITIIASPERLKEDLTVGAAETLRFWTVSDSLGAYSLDGLPDGEYTIRSRTHGPYQATRIAARTGVDYADLVVTMNSAAVAKGRVLTADGAPLEGVTVLPMLPGQRSVLTDDDGLFELPVSLKPTVHRFALRFQRPGFIEQSEQVYIPQANAKRDDLASDIAMQVVMRPVEAWTELTGTVYSDAGDPLAGRAVELRPLSSQQNFATVTDKNGHYIFPFVEAGANYRLTVFGGSEHRDYRQSVRLSADSNALDVTVETYEFGEVAGQVVNLNGVPVPDFDLVLRNTGSSKPNALVSTDAGGNFVVEAAPAGEFVVASQSTPSILVRGLHLSAGEKLNLPLVLDWGEHEIRGSVVDAHDNPVPSSRIILQWSHQADGITTNSSRRTAADEQGQFAFSNIGPGLHSLRIDAPGFLPVAVDHDLSRQGYNLTVRLN